MKIKDVRGQDFVREVAKYVAKGSELAAWPPELLMEFLTAIRGCRFFSTFGSLTAARPEIERTIHDLKNRTVCPCGCQDFLYETELQTILNDARHLSRSKRR